MNKNNKKFFVWVIFTVLQTLSGAEDKSLCIMPHNDEIVLRLVAGHYLDDHDAICSFAKTSMTYHQYMLSLAETKKKLLFTDLKNKLLFTDINGEHLESLCHRYGSAYCRAYRLKHLNDLVLTHSTLKSGLSSGFNYHLNRFISPLPYKQAPFFNGTGKLCFYGYGIMGIGSETETLRVERKDVLTIVQYQTSIDTQSMRLQCLMAKKGDEIGGKQMYRRFDFCMEYPSFLKAILNSSQVTQGSDDQELIFWLDGVTVPDNYAEKVPMKAFSDNWAHNNFEHLPDIIKDFIQGS